MRFWTFGAIAALAVAGCNKTADNNTMGANKPLGVFSQANSQDPWRQVFDAEAKAAAAEHASEFTFEAQEAQDNANTQISQVDALLLKKPAAF